MPIHWMWWPPLGALVVGVGGWIDPRVLGVGYVTIDHLACGEIVGVALISLLIGKAVVWSVALGSGTSGGVLAPLLMMGGALGAWVGHWMPAGDASLWALAGILTRGDLVRALQQDPSGQTTVLDAGQRSLVVTYPDEPITDAIGKLLRHNVGRLPVVERDAPGRLLGYLGRSSVLRARWLRQQEEEVRERGAFRIPGIFGGRSAKTVKPAP